jgi:hypothetical protein
MRNADIPRVVISQNRGETWRRMPDTWRQSGRILEANASIVRQDAGGGREVWYRLEADDEAVALGAPDALGTFIAAMSREDREAFDALLGQAQIAPGDPQYAGIAVSLYVAAALSRRLDEIANR